MTRKKKSPPKAAAPKAKKLPTKVRRDKHTAAEKKGVDDVSGHAQRIGKLKQRKKRNIGRS